MPDASNSKKDEHAAKKQSRSKLLLAAVLVIIVAVLAVAFIWVKPSSSKAPSAVSTSVNSSSSARFFLGPEGQPMNASFINSLSNLSKQLAEVGAQQVNGTFIYQAPSFSGQGAFPGYYVLLFGKGSNQNYDVVPILISNTVSNISIEMDSKPTFVFIGAQGCPFCAAMRWPVAIALSRFGNFSRLFYDRSATIDANIPTIMFNFSEQKYVAAASEPPVYNGQAPYGDEYPTPFSYGAYYSSPYLNFEPFDELGGSFLINITGIKAISPQIYSKVYLEGVSSNATSPNGFGIKYFSIGGVPFFDIDNKYVFDGAILNTRALGLAVNGTHAAFLYALENPNQSPLGQTALGAANLLTAEICTTLNNTAQVCKLPYIVKLESMLSSLNYSQEYA